MNLDGSLVRLWLGLSELGKQISAIVVEVRTLASDTIGVYFPGLTYVRGTLLLSLWTSPDGFLGFKESHSSGKVGDI